MEGLDTEITLVSNDGKEFKISEKAAKKSKVISNAIDGINGPSSDGVTFKKVSGKILELVTKYLENFKDKDPDEIRFPLPDEKFNNHLAGREFELNFINSLDIDTLFELAEASAIWLHIPILTSLCAAKIASLLKGKCGKDALKLFNIDDSKFDYNKNKQIKDKNEFVFNNL